MERTISGMMGKGSVNHNTRAFSAKNVDKERSRDNVEFCHEDIKAVYHELFDEALDEECYQMMERLVEQMKAKQGVTAQLKSENQMQWVGMMNNIRHCAEEVVLKDIVYV